MLLLLFNQAPAGPSINALASQSLSVGQVATDTELVQLSASQGLAIGQTAIGSLTGSINASAAQSLGIQQNAHAAQNIVVTPMGRTVIVPADDVTLGVPKLAWGTKDPADVLDYAIDWSLRLVGDVINTSTWIVPAGIVDNSEAGDGAKNTIWLSGGTVRKTYALVNRVVTTNGRTMDQTVKIKIKTK